MHYLGAAFNKALRRILRLPFNSHRKVLYNVCDIQDFNSIMVNRFISLYNAMLCSKNECINYVAHCAINDSFSFLGHNLNVLFDCYGRKMRDFDNNNGLRKLRIDDDKCVNSSIVTECIRVRDSEMYIDNFDSDDITDIINYWSTTELINWT